MDDGREEFVVDLCIALTVNIVSCNGRDALRFISCGMRLILAAIDYQEEVRKHWSVPYCSVPAAKVVFGKILAVTDRLLAAAFKVHVQFENYRLHRSFLIPNC